MADEANESKVNTSLVYVPCADYVIFEFILKLILQNPHLILRNLFRIENEGHTLNTRKTEKKIHETNILLLDIPRTVLKAA